MTVFFRPAVLAQPPTPLPINRENPITQGLVCSVYNSAQDYAFPMNYVSRVGPARNKDVQPFMSALGVAPSFNGTTSNAYIEPSGMVGCAQFTMAFWLWWNSYANNNSYGICYQPGDGSATGGMFRLNPNDGTGVVALRIFSSSSGAQFATIARPSAAAWHHYVYRINMAASLSPVFSIRVDGKEQTIGGSSSFGGFGSGLIACPLLFFAATASAPSSFSAGKIMCFNVWKRVLANLECDAMYRNSFQVLDAGLISVGVPSTTRPAVAASRWFFGA